MPAEQLDMRVSAHQYLRIRFDEPLVKLIWGSCRSDCFRVRTGRAMTTQQLPLIAQLNLNRRLESTNTLHLFVRQLLCSPPKEILDSLEILISVFDFFWTEEGLVSVP